MAYGGDRDETKRVDEGRPVLCRVRLGASKLSCGANLRLAG